MAFFSNKTVLVFFLISQAKPTLWTLIRNAFSKVFLMNTDNICFLGEIRNVNLDITIIWHHDSSFYSRSNYYCCLGDRPLARCTGCIVYIITMQENKNFPNLWHEK